MENYDHLLGKYGRLTVLKFYRNDKREMFCSCLCDCGKEKNINWQSIKKGLTISCGCYRDEQIRKSNSTHGMSKTKEYESWASMIQRCRDKNCKAYSNYGALGIDVCDYWLHFENFISDMGMKPKGKLELDRIDNTKGYYKENCRWATTQETIGIVDL